MVFVIIKIWLFILVMFSPIEIEILIAVNMDIVIAFSIISWYYLQVVSIIQ